MSPARPHDEKTGCNGRVHQERDRVTARPCRDLDYPGDKAELEASKAQEATRAAELCWPTQGNIARTKQDEVNQPRGVEIVVGVCVCAERGEYRSP
jgi:hypothetical protein